MAKKRIIKSAPNKKAISKTKQRFSDAILASQRKLEEAVYLKGLRELTTTKLVEEQPTGIIFRNKMSKFCRRVTSFVLILVFIFFFYLFYSSSGTYLSAWFMSLAMSVFLLYLISFPRSLKVTNKHLIINCVLEITTIELRDIKRIHPVNRYRLKRVFPLLGSYGFGGFYGIYIDLIHFRIFKLYATKLSNLVIIQDIYDDRYIVSCENRDLFVERVRKNIEELKSVTESSK